VIEERRSGSDGWKGSVVIVVEEEKRRYEEDASEVGVEGWDESEDKGGNSDDTGQGREQ
jgi:hypothetical protein